MDTPKDDEKLVKLLSPPRRKVSKLHLPAVAHNAFVPSSPCTPSSVFSFDIPNSPAYSHLRKRRAMRSISQPADPLLSPISGVFSFDFASPSIGLDTPKTPRTPHTGILEDIAEDSHSSTHFSYDKAESPTLRSPKSPSTVSSVSSSPSFASHTHWSSIRVAAVVLFLIRMQFTVYFASLWPFLQELDSSVTPSFFAYTGAVYSVGVAVSAPLFGYWSNKLGEVRIPTQVSLLLMFISNLMYLAVPVAPLSARKWIMMLTRFVVGIAAGSSSCLNTYWSYSARVEDRSMAAAITDGAFCLGIALGPVCQLLFTPLSYPGRSLIGPFQLNMYTAPACMALVAVAAAAVLLHSAFHETHTQVRRVGGGGAEKTAAPPAPYDKAAVAVCIAIKFVQMFIYANMETIGSPYTSWMFSLSRSETTTFNSRLVSLSGTLGFAFLAGYVWTKIGKKVDNRTGILVGIALCVSFLVVTFPWASYGDVIGRATGGCPYEWCEWTPRISPLVYSSAYVIVFGIGFPLTNVHLAALYSQVLGRRMQGTMQGVNSLVSSLSRIAGPVIVTEVFTLFGPGLVWQIQLVTWTLILLPIFVCYNRLVAID